jgi:CDP-diacylglycerol--glycerol-3-phosphate 3-phosphatidyltransferase
MNTANKITLLRILLVPIFMALFMAGTPGYLLAAVIVFVVAAATDGIDGYIARRYNQITTFGKFVDPLADKMLTTAALLVLMHFGRVSAWVVMIVMAREFVVAGIRLSAVSEGKVIAASMWGKLKTVSQMVAIIAAMILMYDFFPQATAQIITDILIWLSTIFTVISGVDYVVKNRHLLKMK